VGQTLDVPVVRTDDQAAHCACWVVTFFFRKGARPSRLAPGNGWRKKPDAVDLPAPSDIETCHVEADRPSPKGRHGDLGREHRDRIDASGNVEENARSIPF
jgi:hypothetical protein